MHNHIPQWTYGERLRKARADAGLEQEEMASRLGVSTGTISNWELGRTQGRKMLTRVEEWAEITGVPAAWLLGIEDPALVPGGQSTIEYISETAGRAAAALVRSVTLRLPRLQFHYNAPVALLTV
jgi:transcriptional regulator with XRE-family HTH domain